MPIIIEGPDNAGKTILANHLATRLGSYIHHPGPKAKSYGIMENDCKQFMILALGRDFKNDIFDRFPCISESIYKSNLGDKKSDIVTFCVEMLRTNFTPIIYCRPESTTIVDYTTHNRKSYDTEGDLQNC